MPLSKCSIYGLTVTSLFGLLASPGLAQISAAGDGTGTIVNNSVANQFEIKDGTRSGTNLFHSFQQFNIGKDQTASFIVSPDIQNVLARVSGGATSIVDGTIQMGGNGNLYLMNPAGIIFGNNAKLDLPAAFVGTTANGIGFGNGQWFSASGANNLDKLSGAPTQFAFTESNPGVIINAGNLNTPNDKPLALIGGTIVSTQYWEKNGALALATVEGAQVVELTLPGQLLRLAVKVTPMQAGDAIPNRWATPIANLPTLLTGGDVQNATKITTDANGRIILSAANPQAITINSGDIVVDSIKIVNRTKQGDIYDVWIDAQKTFRALGTVTDGSSINSNSKIRLPVSIRSIGKTTINQGGESFTEGIGYQKDADGVVIQDLSGRRVLLDGKTGGSPDLPGTQITQFKYKDTGENFDLDPPGGTSIGSPENPAFNPSQTNPSASYTKGLIVVQDSEGNGSLLGSLQDSSLSGTRNIQIVTTLRPKGTVISGNTGTGGNTGTDGNTTVTPPKPRPPETNCVSGQQSLPNTRSSSSSAICTSGQVPAPGQAGQILQILPSP